jgi:hypothetical protein
MNHLETDGWTHWAAKAPPANTLVLAAHPDVKTTPILITREELGLDSNVVGIYWKLTGIGRMQLEEQEIDQHGLATRRARGA